MKTLKNIKTLIKTSLLSLLIVGCSWSAIKKGQLGMMDAGGMTPAQAEEQWEDFVTLLDNAGNWYEITNFLDQNKDFVNSKHKWEKDTGYTAFHYAANQGDLDVVKELIGRGAEVNAKTGQGITPLHLAAAAGNLEVVECIFEALKERGEETNPKDKNGFTPLHIVVTNEDEDLTKYIIKQIPDAIEVVADDGNTPLHFAVALRNTRIVGALLDSEDSKAVNKAILKKNKGDKTPLDVARNEEIKKKLKARL